MAIQVRARLGRRATPGSPAPGHAGVLDHPTIEALSRFLETEILGFKEAPVVPAEASPLANRSRTCPRPKPSAGSSNESNLRG